MFTPDLSYLRRVRDVAAPSALLLEPAFLAAQDLFFSVVRDMQGSVDFDIAHMREVHAVAALRETVCGKKILDVGCGSTEAYVLDDTFRDRYPPFFAEMLQRLGAKVTGTDIRPYGAATYDHRVLDSAQEGWTKELEPTYDMVACLNIFNAPASPFEHDVALCDRLMREMAELLAKDGLLLLTVRDDFFRPTDTLADKEERVRQSECFTNFSVLHIDGNTVWLGQPRETR